MSAPHEHHLVPKSLGEIRAKRKPIVNVKDEHRKQLSASDRLALLITERVGTMGFFFIIFIWTFLWLLWNFFAPEKLRFDPPMNFVFWLFISNCIQILLMPLIMVGQNVQARGADLRAQNDFDINIKAEQEVETILQHLEMQNAMITALLDAQGIKQQAILEMMKNRAEGGPPATA